MIALYGRSARTLITVICRVLATGFPKSDHVSNGITIAHMIAFGKTGCKNSANCCSILYIKENLSYYLVLSKGTMYTAMT